MKLVCPGCAAVASAESWVNDELCRETLAVVTRLPGTLPKVALGYLSLFRPGAQALSWKKALRLAGEIEQLVSPGYVKVHGKVDRNCPPAIWARAMEQMIEQRSGLELPLKNHRYLCKVAWGMADQADYQAEKKQTTTAQNTRVRQGNGADPGVYDPIKIKEEYRKRMQVDESKTSIPQLSDVLKDID